MKIISRIVPETPHGWDSWESLMFVAIEQAKLGMNNGEVPVGAVIVSSEGDILGLGQNYTESRHDPTAHAEIVALRNASKKIGNQRLNGAIMAVTLEPCLMCTGALVHARLSGVVYGAYDIKAGAVSSCVDGLDLPFHNSTVWHMGGVLEPECSTLLQEFFSLCRKDNSAL